MTAGHRPTLSRLANILGHLLPWVLLVIVASLPLLAGCSFIPVDLDQPPNSALIVGEGDPAPDEGNASVTVLKVDGHVTKFKAAFPGKLRLLRKKQPLYLVPGSHSLDVYLDTDWITSYPDQFSVLDDVSTTDVLKVNLVLRHSYRFTNSYDGREFHVSFWDVTNGNNKRTLVGSLEGTGRSVMVGSDSAP
jgi:hypothetical protein